MPTVSDPMSGGMQATLCSFNSYIIITLSLGGLLVVSLIILIGTCIYCRYAQQKSVAVKLNELDNDMKTSSHSYPDNIFDEESRTSYRDLPIEFTDPPQLPVSTAV